jgi:hypothetical protein
MIDAVDSTYDDNSLSNHFFDAVSGKALLGLLSSQSCSRIPWNGESFAMCSRRRDLRLVQAALKIRWCINYPAASQRQSF